MSNTSEYASETLSSVHVNQPLDRYVAKLIFLFWLCLVTDFWIQFLLSLLLLLNWISQTKQNGEWKSEMLLVRVKPDSYQIKHYSTVNLFLHLSQLVIKLSSDCRVSHDATRLDKIWWRTMLKTFSISNLDLSTISKYSSNQQTAPQPLKRLQILQYTCI